MAAEEETIDIYILGEVASPGPAAAPPGVTVLQALSLAGGVTRFAATKRSSFAVATRAPGGNMSIRSTTRPSPRARVSKVTSCWAKAT